MMFDVSVNCFWDLNGCKMQRSGVSSEKENLICQEKNTWLTKNTHTHAQNEQSLT